MPCFDIKNISSKYKDQRSLIKQCYWKDTEVDCSAIFKATPTDKGICCTFNLEKAEKMFKKSIFEKTIKKLQEMDQANR